ncbi:MAG: dihydropteroate synthase [Rickettsiaceae bacterium]|nr:dihydropteroate synthase [Rickettsiaceae bacterium]
MTNLRQAIRLFTEHVEIIYESIILETTAILPKNAPDSWNKPYLNMVLVIKTKLSPHRLLNHCKNIEQRMGRKEPYEKWSPRIIDLDILFYNDKQIDSIDLQIPHSQITDRPFIIHLLTTLPKDLIPQVKINNHFIWELAHQQQTSMSEIFHKSYSLASKLVGIINVTPDSFSDGGKNYDPEKAFINCQNLINDGAEILDIGAQSTRPSAAQISNEQELSRLIPLLDKLKEHNYLDSKISIDCYQPTVIRKLLTNYKIDWVNDVTGNLPKNLLEEIASSNCKIVVMNSLNIPENRTTHLDITKPIINQLYSWANKIIDKLIACGFKQKNIILDPGIGFGKSIYQNVHLLQSIKKLKSLGYPLLIGHSRKSFISAFSNSAVSNRDIETIAVSEYLNKITIDYLRVHNVLDHHKFFVTKKILQDA